MSRIKQKDTAQTGAQRGAQRSTQRTPYYAPESIEIFRAAALKQWRENPKCIAKRKRQAALVAEREARRAARVAAKDTS